jgi:hypothetical protein
MKRHNALHSARDQITWIVALVASTAIVVQLERLDLSQTGALVQNPFAEARTDPAALVAQTRASQGESDLALARHATALALALLQESELSGLRTEAQGLRDTLAARLDWPVNEAGADGTAGVASEPLLGPAAAILDAALSWPDGS